MSITSFSGDYRFLSNFWPCSVVLDGILYPSVENAYQAAKTTDNILRRYFETCTAGKAKRAGRELDVRSDWNEIKLSTMTDLVTQKFTKDISLSQMLRDTRPNELIEGNTWGDVYWGVCNGVGSNHLGKILMTIRDRICMDENFTLI